MLRIQAGMRLFASQARSPGVHSPPFRKPGVPVILRTREMQAGGSEIEGHHLVVKYVESSQQTGWGRAHISTETVVVS